MDKKMKELGLAKAKTEDLVKVPEFIRIYANNVQMSITLWDINLLFGEIGEATDGGITIEQKVKVNMTREMAKALYNLLGTNLAAYESKLGEIKILNSQAYENAIEAVMTEREAKAKPKQRKPRSK